MRERRVALNATIEHAWRIPPEQKRALVASLAASFDADRAAIAARRDNQNARLRAACLHACLDLELRRPDAARESLRETLRLHPDAAPNPREHSPFVVQLVQRMLAEQRTFPTATWSVSGRGASPREFASH